MILELSDHEAKLLKKHLGHEIRHVENELVHTDKHALQHELAREVDALKALERRIQEQLA
jgi:hypothetical protein